jgi:vancomycin resistance protein YoaR
VATIYSNRAAKIGVVSVALAAGVGTAAFKAGAGVPDGIISEGVHVAGMDWSNKPFETAKAELEGWSKARLAEPLTLALPAKTGVKKTWTLTRAELGADVDAEATFAKATGVGRDTGFFMRIGEIFNKPKPVDLAPEWKIDSDKLRAFLAKKIAPKVLHAPKDARFLATKEGFQIVPELPGAQLDIDNSLAAIRDRIPQTAVEPVELAVKVAPPHDSSADLKGIEGEVARYQTHYGETGNRCKNIVTACSHINGTVLKPGDVFSYNKVVGPREGENGFRMAPVIVNGRLEPGMGGGVCQTSSTLYNAVLLSDLKVVERSHHAFPVHYLPAGRDATVAYGDKDFRFQNNTDAPIAVAADGTGGRVLMRIFGKKAPGREVKIERTNVSSWGPSVETVRDSSLPLGVRRSEKKDNGHAGHRVTVWRTVVVNGKQVKREPMSHDYYQAFPKIVHVGTRVVALRPKKLDTTPHDATPAPPAPTTPGSPAGGQ